MKRVLTFILFFSVLMVSAQTESEFKDFYKKSIDDLHISNGKIIPNTTTFGTYAKLFPQTVLNEVKKNEKDTLYEVRWLNLRILSMIVKESSDTLVKQESCYLIVKKCSDKDKSLAQQSVDLLKYYPKNAYNEQSKQLLISYLDNPAVYPNMIKMIGFLDLKSQIPKLNSMLNDSLIKKESIRWDIRLALARLGVETQIEYVTNYARTIDVNNATVRFLFKDLIYTKSRMAFDYLIEELNNDNKLCGSSNPYSSSNIVCGYRIMELLAPVVKDFPYGYHETTGQLRTNNYDQALMDIRLWFQQNPDYVILTDKY